MHGSPASISGVLGLQALAEDTHKQGRAEWSWPVRVPGLRTIQAIVMTVVSFPQNAQRRVIRSGEHPLGGWRLQARWRSNYIRFLCRMDLCRGEKG